MVIKAKTHKKESRFIQKQILNKKSSSKNSQFQAKEKAAKISSKSSDLQPKINYLAFKASSGHIAYPSELQKCIEKYLESSAFSPSFKNDDRYFRHGHSRCLANGNYDPIQCVNIPGLVDGICVCVNPWSEPDHLGPNGTTAYQSTISDLHCYDEKLHTVDYYRPCEKVVFDIEVIQFLHYFPCIMIFCE